MISVPRLRTAIRYLTCAHPPHKWKLSRWKCPACGDGPFLSLKRKDIMTRCFGCGANAVNLSVLSAVRKEFGSQLCAAHAYELPTYGTTLNFLPNNFGRFTDSEYMPDEVNGAVIKGI